METNSIIYYDDAFIAKFEKLQDVIEAGDKPALHRYLIDNFGHIFDVFQRCAKDIAGGGAPDFDALDDGIKRELMRPLSYRQFSMIQRAFSIWTDEKDLVISSIWDFLHDCGRIYEKRVMSSAEVSGCSLILLEVYRCL